MRIGNLAYRQVPHGVYGSVILAATHVLFDQRLTRRGDDARFHRLEVLGEQARRCYDQPDAGFRELRSSERAYFFVGDVLGGVRPPGTDRRPARAGQACGVLVRPCHADARDDQQVEWNRKRGAFVSTFDGKAMDASPPLLAEVGFLDAANPRFVATVSAVEKDLRHGDFIFPWWRRTIFASRRTSYWYAQCVCLHRARSGANVKQSKRPLAARKPIDCTALTYLPGRLDSWRSAFQIPSASNNILDSYAQPAIMKFNIILDDETGRRLNPVTENAGATRDARLRQAAITAEFKRVSGVQGNNWR